MGHHQLDTLDEQILQLIGIISRCQYELLIIHIRLLLERTDN